MDSKVDIPTTCNVASGSNAYRQQQERRAQNQPFSAPKASALRNPYRLVHDLATSPSLSTVRQVYQRDVLRHAYQGLFDRVNVLGNDEGYGHTGCVNALSWALDGDVLVSGGDDTTLRFWKLDPNDTSTPYPYKQSSIIQTGHTGNVFNAQMLPSSSRIATVAGDRQVRIFDAERALTTSGEGRKIDFSERETCIRVLRCHSGRTKRIVTEESSDVFLTVAEDGTVRQHDLRTPHRCSRNQSNCPPPLVTMPHDLSTLALSPLAPHLFVVAGESPFGYLFDRRQVDRTLRAEWGVPCNNNDYVTCVRRFGRTQRGPAEALGAEHITGARMAQTNGHEIDAGITLADAVYLYSARDDPQEFVTRLATVLPPNPKRRKLSLSESISSSEESTDSGEEGNSTRTSALDSSSESSSRSQLHLHIPDREYEGEDEDSSDTNAVSQPVLDEKFKKSTILPRRRFSGHCNVDTVKDVNFIGADDEYVASGSDDGNFFLWEKNTGHLHGIYEGDGSVVNVIENHPCLPLIACSGIDTTVKLFAPMEKNSFFSRLHNADDIIGRNAAAARRSARTQNGFANLFMQYRMALRRVAEDDSEEGEPQCTFQ
ncbi:hypothetical protein EW145_g3845 [Phellinidium pouzarii]|uniref:Uncharacterized protein n=1 Tax=Phellinidium pouzarii TaxID=167371 RepID=A0A4S4L5X9_9AGAM|nr:hypothetical protein EW145_g3845 [Phellinidium pouzarii]